MTTEIPTIYRAYTRTPDPTLVSGYKIFDMQNVESSAGYTDDPYRQPAMFHNAIALLDAAHATCAELKGVGGKRTYECKVYTQVDYYIDEEFLLEQRHCA